jgi:hypothetical protein|tara:strand:- start:634 stop:1635 length:1002 start_codon:yes stop_codon:yes gene_type:complete
MLKIRKLNTEKLHTETILNRISEYDIFRYYCPNFKQLNVKFCSELRDDKTPSVSIGVVNNKLLYKDFGYPEHSFGSFGYVQHKYGCDFIAALKIIDCDFNLGIVDHADDVKSTMGYIGYKQTAPELVEKVTIIKKRKRDWNVNDKNFWSNYLINKNILFTFGVEPITHYWINSNRFTCKSVTYAYRFGKKYKIYAPYETDNKWASNTNKKIIQGYKQLPETGDLCIITSSLKDVMCLFSMGIPAIALQSEMQIPEEKTIKELQTRFKKVAVFYDNDFDKPNNPGQTMAAKICQKYYPIKNIVIPDVYKLKDPSDYIAHFKSHGGLKTLIRLQL